jgi:hypothetical protein
MTSQAPLPIDPETFEAYLDGRLSGPDAAAVEEAVRRDPALAEEVALQRRINDSLRSHFVPPAIEVPVPAPIPFLRAPGQIRRWTWFAAAAALVLCVSGALWYTIGKRPSGPEGLYHRLAAASFKPDWVCGDDAEFAFRVRYRLGDAFLVHADSAVGLIGWKYVSDPLSPQALALMATVDGDHSVVLVDRLIRDKPLTVSPSSGLNLFRKEMGGLVMYEITPLKSPRILDLAYPAPKEAPPDQPPPP